MRKHQDMKRILLAIAAIFTLLTSCSKPQSEYRLHGGPDSISINELNSNGEIVKHSIVPLVDGVSDIITASESATSIEVPEQKHKSKLDGDIKTYYVSGKIALAKDGVTEIWIKVK